jgi:hypothetical protein
MSHISNYSYVTHVTYVVKKNLLLSFSGFTS